MFGNSSQSKRVVFHTDESFYDRDADGYRIVAITEDEPGYRPTRHLYLDVAHGQRAASQMNHRNGLTPQEVLAIRVSSMAASPNVLR